MVLFGKSAALLTYFVVSAISVSGENADESNEMNLPPHHPMMDVVAGFADQLRCPHAKEWMTKGPEQAAIDLGLISGKSLSNKSSRRDLSDMDAENSVMGNCVYTNLWSGGEACLEMRGSLWTAESMDARCNQEEGILTTDQGCSLPTLFAGFCVIQNADGATEATPFEISESMSCSATKGLCESTMQGKFVAEGDCVQEDAESAGVCEIAPGPIGGAHQSGFASGYRAECEGTPAEGSPYMWPLRWAADTESQSMDFGSDEVKFHSRGRVYYRLDKNWKRQDWRYQQGEMRSVTQGLKCDEDDILESDEDHENLCIRNSTRKKTVIHRGPKMIFIRWKNTTNYDDDDVSNIEDCYWMDMSVVGCVRPDWFLDSIGDSTDAQYLGNQHVYYEGRPRLVKQWRKSDFANQYFTMSMLENVGSDGVHWPMILNVPGEGFGPDSLRYYANHTMLGEDDEARFLLDEQLEAAGFLCPELTRENHEEDRPEAREHIPSNLEIDPEAWISNEYTYSTVWEPPARDSEGTGSTSGVTEAGLATIESCYDESTSSVQMSVNFKDVVTDDGVLPWVAIGYREDEECVMIPRSGDVSNMILITTPEAGSLPMASYGPLPAELRMFDQTAISSIDEGMIPLEQVDGFSDVEISFAGETAVARSGTNEEHDTLELHFTQTMESTPEAMHLMYAVGSSQEFGYHKTRMCFDITDFPSCSAAAAVESPEDPTTNVAAPASMESESSATWLGFGVAHTTGIMALAVVIARIF